MLETLRDESLFLIDTDQIMQVLVCHCQSPTEDGLEHSDPEILKEVQFTVMNPKDPFTVKYSRRFQDEGISVSAFLKSDSS